MCPLKSSYYYLACHIQRFERFVKTNTRSNWWEKKTISSLNLGHFSLLSLYRFLLKLFTTFFLLRIFAKFRGKHLCQFLFFNKVADLRPATLLKLRLWHRCFSLNFAKFLRAPSFIELLWWLLLTINNNNLLWCGEVLANSVFLLSKLGSFSDFIT